MHFTTINETDFSPISYWRIGSKKILIEQLYLTFCKLSNWDYSTWCSLSPRVDSLVKIQTSPCTIPITQHSIRVYSLGWLHSYLFFATYCTELLGFSYFVLKCIYSLQLSLIQSSCLNYEMMQHAHDFYWFHLDCSLINSFFQDRNNATKWMLVLLVQKNMTLVFHWDSPNYEAEWWAINQDTLTLIGFMAWQTWDLFSLR